MKDFATVATERRRRRRRDPEAARPACVVGEIDLVTALGAAGIPCAVAAVPGDPATRSRYTAETIEWFDPWEEQERMVTALLEWGRRQKRPVLFYNGDHDLLLVSRNREALSECFDFVIGEGGLVEDLVDKQRFHALAKRLDLPVPPNRSFDAAITTYEGVEVPFPAVVKPTTRRHDVWAPLAGEKKAIRVDEPEALRRLWPRLRGQGRMIVQSLVAGAEDRVESYHVYAGESGEILCEFTGRKIRTLPPSFGDTTSLVITDRPDVARLGRDLVGRMGLTGVAKFDFKRDDSGRLWLLEVNPRFNLWHNAGAAAGANIPAAVYRRLTGGEPASCSARPGVTWCHLTRDLKAARAADVPALAWLRWALRTDVKWAVSLRDPMPFVGGVLLRRLAGKLGRG